MQVNYPSFVDAWSQFFSNNDAVRMILNNSAAQFRIGQVRPQTLALDLLPIRSVASSDIAKDYSYASAAKFAGAQNKESRIVGSESGTVAGIEARMVSISEAFYYNSAKWEELFLNNIFNSPQEAVATILNDEFRASFVNEQERRAAELICTGGFRQLTRTGGELDRYTVDGYEPAGHRVTSATGWTVATVDPMLEVLQQRDLLESKNFEVSKIITSLKVAERFYTHPLVIQRAQRGSTIVPTRDEIKRFLLSEYRIPEFEIYNLKVVNPATQLASPIMPESAFVMLGATQKTVKIIGAPAGALQNVLGFTAEGLTHGGDKSGTVQGIWVNKLKFEEEHPVGRFKLEGVLNTVPVLTAPQAIAVITVN